MSTSRYKQFGVGWVQNKNGKQYISAKANGKLQKVKLLAELENGTTVPLNSFVVFFNDEKPNDKAPDVQFVFTPEE